MLTDPTKLLNPESVDISQFDLSGLVGTKVTVYAAQFSHQPLCTRILMVEGSMISIDRSGGSGLIDNLVPRQWVTIRADYRGEEIAFKGTVKRTEGGACNIMVASNIVPLRRRNHPRASVKRILRLAVLPVQASSIIDLSRLRWIETITINISGGGTLFESRSILEPPTYLCLSIDFKDVSFPHLVIGQVQHCNKVKSDKYLVGVEFIPRENRRTHLSSGSMRSLPEKIFVFDNVQQILISKRIAAWMQQSNDKH